MLSTVHRRRSYEERETCGSVARKFHVNHIAEEGAGKAEKKRCQEGEEGDDMHDRPHRPCSYNRIYRKASEGVTQVWEYRTLYIESLPPEGGKGKEREGQG